MVTQINLRHMVRQIPYSVLVLSLPHTFTHTLHVALTFYALSRLRNCQNYSVFYVRPYTT